MKSSISSGRFQLRIMQTAFAEEVEVDGLVVRMRLQSGETVGEYNETLLLSQCPLMTEENKVEVRGERNNNSAGFSLTFLHKFGQEVSYRGQEVWLRGWLHTHFDYGLFSPIALGGGGCCANFTIQLPVAHFLFISWGCICLLSPNRGTDPHSLWWVGKSICLSYSNISPLFIHLSVTCLGFPFQWQEVRQTKGIVQEWVVEDNNSLSFN